MSRIKTRSAIFMSSGSLVLLSIGLSRFDKRWLWLGGVIGASLLYGGMRGFCLMAHFLEKAKITQPDYGHYENERLKDIHKLKLIRKIRKVRKEIAGYIKEVEAREEVNL